MPDVILVVLHGCGRSTASRPCLSRIGCSVRFRETTVTGEALCVRTDRPRQDSGGPQSKSLPAVKVNHCPWPSYVRLIPVVRPTAWSSHYSLARGRSRRHSLPAVTATACTGAPAAARMRRAAAAWTAQSACSTPVQYLHTWNSHYSVARGCSRHYPAPAVTATAARTVDASCSVPVEYLREWRSHCSVARGRRRRHSVPAVTATVAWTARSACSSTPLDYQ